MNTHSVNESSSKELSRLTVMHMGLQLNGTVKFGPLTFPNVSINVEMYSKDFKRCDNTTKAAGLNLSATFFHQKALGQFFTTSTSDSVRIFLPSDSQNKTEGILNTTVALLGDSFRTQVEISNLSLSFEKKFHLFHTYRLSVRGSSRLQRWDSLQLTVNGLFGRSERSGGRDTLEDSLKEMIKGYIKVIVENTVHRLSALQNISDKMSSRLEKSKFRLGKAENNSQLAVTRYLWALKAQHAALKSAKTAEKNVFNSNQEVNQLKSSLESLCSVTECPYVCVTGTACNTCYKDLISKEQGLCPATCHKVLQERIPPFSEMRSCLEENCELSSRKDKFLGISLPSSVSCTFENIGKSILTTGAQVAVTYGLVSVGVPPVIAYPVASGTVTYATTGDEKKAAEATVMAAGSQAIFGIPDPVEGGVIKGAIDSYNECNDEGEWDCSVGSYSCVWPLFNYKVTAKPYSCKISCEVNVIKETIATPCCKEVNCASRLRDLRCKENNAFCRIAREKAISKLNIAKRNLVEPLVKLQQAKRKLRVSEIELSKKKIELEAATTERNTLRRAHEALAKAANISRRANDQNRASIQDAITLAKILNSTNETCPVDIKEVSFDVTLSSPSETSIPVLFKVASKNREKAFFAVVNFASLNHSLELTAKQIVKELFGNVSTVLRSGHPLNQMPSTQSKGRRRKRAIDEGESDVVTLVEFKRKCALVTNYQYALSDIIGLLYKISTEALQHGNVAMNHTTKHQHAKPSDFGVNRTQAVMLGLSDDDIDDAKNAVSSDQEVVSATSLIELRNATNRNKVQTVMEVVYRDWEASMESVFNCTSLECSGFEDCMEDFVDNLNYLYEGVELAEAVLYRRKLKTLSTEVKNLLSLEDPSLDEAAKRSSRILGILKEIKDEKIFCAVAPNITNHPEAMKDLKIGNTLELTCKATGVPPPSYRWRKNGVLLPESNTEVLRIEQMSTKDSGNYTCEAYNHLSVESSTPSFVLVHSPPTLVYYPPRKLNIPINTGFYLRCNATSVTRPLQYQWLFKPSNEDGYIVVPNGNYSVLKFGSIQKHEEGFYRCNVSNPFDYVLSNDVHVRVLGFSLAVPSLELSFDIDGDSRNLHSAYEGINKVKYGRIGLRVPEHFLQDVQLSFTRVVSNLVNLSSNAVQNFTIEDYKAADQGNNITFSLSFRLCSLNVTGPESMNRTERENAISIMESVKRLKLSAAVLVNETATRGIRLNVKNASLEVDPASWSTGEYISLCPVGTVLYVNNFVCGK